MPKKYTKSFNVSEHKTRLKNSHDPITQGCCDFVGQIILGACNPPQVAYKLLDNEKSQERLRLIKINTRWVLNSKLLTHYCDVMNIPIEKVQQAVFRNNQ